MFCRELCEVTLFENREKLGGPGKVVQIDESKIGKRKYHRGHVVEGHNLVPRAFSLAGNEVGRDSGFSGALTMCLVLISYETIRAFFF